MITEQQIREVFAHLKAVGSRWYSDVSFSSGEYVRLYIPEEGIEYLDFREGWNGDDDYHDRIYIPLLAFTDYDAAVKQVQEEQQRKRLASEEANAIQKRALYERLKKELGA